MTAALQAERERPIIVHVAAPATPDVHVAVPAQPPSAAPVITIDVQPIADAILEAAQMPEEITVQRDSAGLMTSATKRRRKKGS